MDNEVYQARFSQVFHAKGMVFKAKLRGQAPQESRDMREKRSTTEPQCIPVTRKTEYVPWL